MTITCSACATENADAAKFCQECATPLAAAAGPTERRERRVVSVLFADLAGFTVGRSRWMWRMWRASSRPYLAVLRSEVERTGGQVVKFTGDGVMAIFGAVAAHEDDPERAVRAALGICERVSRGRRCRLAGAGGRDQR